MRLPIIKSKYIPGKSVYSECTRCRLSRTRRRVAIEKYGGSGTTKLLFIGEQPKELEDTTGHPFLGRNGKILNFIFKYSQKDFQYLLTHAVGCRTCDVVFMTDDLEDEFYQGEISDTEYEINNWDRPPTLSELEHCRYHLVEMEQKFKPVGIVYLGKLATTYKTKLPSLLLRSPSWIDELDYKLLAVRQEALKLNRFIETLFPC